MMLELNEDQTRALAEALDSYLSDLSSEIHHTDSAAFRDGLKRRRELLAGILEALRSTET